MSESSGHGGPGPRAEEAVDAWLARRLEGVPEEFRPWLLQGRAPEDEGAAGIGDDVAEEAGGSPDSVAEALEVRGRAALRRALEAPGRNRESAFRLLAADAYLTWTSEALLDDPDPPGALAALLRRVAAEDE